MTSNLIPVGAAVGGALVASLWARYSRQCRDAATTPARGATRANDRPEAIDAAEAAAPLVQWRARRVERHSWSLVNEGADTAHDVRVTSRDVLFTAGPFAPRPPEGDVRALFTAEVPHHDSIRFVIADLSPRPGAGASVLVAWRGHDEPVRVPLVD